MKKFALAVAFVLAALPWASQAQEPYPTAPAAQRQTYFAAKVGAVAPQHEDLEGFENGFAFDLAIGRRLGPNFALEASVGRFSMSASGFDPTIGNLELTFAVIPVTATAKLIAPAGNLEFFALLGMGVNFVEAKGEADIGASVSDDATSFGLQLGGGLAAHLTPQVTLGADVRYFAAKADLFGFEGGLDSVLVGGTLAFSF